MQYQGNLLPLATSVVTTSNTLPSGAFAFSGAANKIALSTGTILAAFGAANGNAAIVQNSYGQGKGLVYLFDWVGTLQTQSGSALLTATFNQSLTAILPAVPISVVGDAYVPLDTKLVNAVASAQIVDVIATVPNALVIIAPVTPSATSSIVNGSSTVTTWRVTVGANATQYIDWAVRAPATSGTYVIGYQVNLISGTTSTPLTSKNLSIVVQGADQGAAQTVTAIQALAPTSAAERSARDRAVTDVQTANTKLNVGLYEDAVTNYLAATAEFANITTVSVTATETAIDRLLQEAGRKWCHGGTSCTVSTAGLPSGYNVTVFGSASFGNGQADGSIGVGGAASLSSYSVGSALSGDLARLIVGGSLSYSNGSVGQNGTGVIKVGGAASVAQNVARADLKTATVVEAWAALKTQYLTFSDRLATQPGTAATIVSGNQFNCAGTNPTFNVCNLTGTQLTQARTLNLNYLNTASVLVNVSGIAAATMTNGQANWNGQPLSGSAYTSRVFFNFPQATGLTISGFGIGGTILAPRAALAHSNSLIDGPVIVNSLSSTGSYKCTGTFQGTLPNLP